MNQYLSADIGGTNTRLAVIGVNGTDVSVIHGIDYRSRDYATFEELLSDFLSRTQCLSTAHIPADVLNHDKALISRAAFGIAGPVQGAVAQTTNLPWRINAESLQQQFGLPHCFLLNDLEATAYGIPALREKDLVSLQSGEPNACGNTAVIAAGTGLGEAGLYWDGQRHRPFATEGGHASFCPSDEMELALLRHLQLHRQRRHQHVSWERVVSGRGLLGMHEFLCLYRNAPVPQWLAEEIRAGDAAAVIAKAALFESDKICVETLNWFVRLYGAEAGNLALKTLSRGGIYVGGGIAPKILPMLQTGAFLDAFLDKGPMRSLLEAMPVKVILNDRAALFGPALRAAQLDIEAPKISP